MLSKEEKKLLRNGYMPGTIKIDYSRYISNEELRGIEEGIAKHLGYDSIKSIPPRERMFISYSLRFIADALYSFRAEVDNE